ncbi:Hypothetical predicted protein [Pelobates cultripes]|uniref:Uncharacterized protein n=1 Tax=Pelobates cultripes TaxID=61616 RepID=A0AAD1VN24_PELCU|nr:Hypothetical predicted protein [Pelobates cultripes]
MASLAHIWWHCPLTQRYWTNIATMIHTVTGTHLPHTPHTLLFLIIPTSIPKTQKTLLTHLLTAANLLIPVKWKNTEVREWIAKVDSIKTMEEIHASISHRYTLFRETWEPWVRFMAENSA